MIYFANPSTQSIRDVMRQDRLGLIATPNSTRASQRVEGVTWCADNGCFGNNFNEQRWWEWLEEHAKDADTCQFATAPDVVGDHTATLKRSAPWLPKIRNLGYKAAFVAQDGAHIETVPWDKFDVLFIGGTTEWKLGPDARALAGHANSIGMWVHMGRVNSLKRFRYAESIGCSSADGTFLIFGPDKRLPELLGWIDDLANRPALFQVDAS